MMKKINLAFAHIIINFKLKLFLKYKPCVFVFDGYYLNAII